MCACKVRDAPEPIAVLIPLDPTLAANPEPSPCNASEAAARLCSTCDASDARLGRHNCSGHGTCVHGRCWYERALTPQTTRDPDLDFDPSPSPQSKPHPSFNPNTSSKIQPRFRAGATRFTVGRRACSGSSAGTGQTPSRRGAHAPHNNGSMIPRAWHCSLHGALTPFTFAVATRVLRHLEVSRV